MTAEDWGYTPTRPTPPMLLALADGMPKPHPLRYGVVTPEWNKVKPL